MAEGFAGRARRVATVALVALGLGGAVAAPAPADTRPVITGTPQHDQVLTASLAGATEDVTYAWLRCDELGQACVTIGATGSTYTTVAEDEGRRLRVRSTDAGVTATSGPTAIIGLATVIERPSIQGDDFTLRGQEGRYAPEYGIRDIRMQWLRCTITGASCVAVTGEDAYHEWTLVDEDFAKRLKLRVRVTNRAGTLVVDSLATGPIGKPRPSAYMYKPSVTGVATPGQTLTAHQGMWYPGADKIDSFVTAWWRCDAAGANCTTKVGDGATYVPTADDLGRKLRATIVASNAAGTTRWMSGPTRAVGAPVLKVRPVVTGTARIGETLTAGTGSWNPAADTYTYEWRRCYGPTKCGSAGTGPSYLVTENDRYSELLVRVTATNAYGSTVGVSLATERVPSEG